MRNAEIKAALEKIAAANDGILRPRDVVAAARDKKSPLHGRFEWSNDKAAEAWREEQARRLIHEVKYVFTTETRKISSVYYLRDTQTEDQGYLSQPRVRTEEQRAVETIAEEFGRVRALLERTRDIAIGLGLASSAELATRLLGELAVVAVPEQQAAAVG